MRLFKRLAVVMAGVMAAVVLYAVPANAAWFCPGPDSVDLTL